jgi:hypothetical protein
MGPVSGASEWPRLNETHARAVSKDFYEEFLPKNPEAELEEVVISFRRGSIFDRGPPSTLYFPFKVERERGGDKKLRFTFNKDWQFLCLYKSS